MAIRLTKGQVRKLNALRKSVGDDLAEEVFAKWLEREAASSAKSKPDPVAMKIVEALDLATHRTLRMTRSSNSEIIATHYAAPKARVRHASSHTRMKRRKKRRPRLLKLRSPVDDRL